MNKADISLPRGEVVMVSAESKTGFPMRHHDWQKIKNKISSVEKNNSFWTAFGWKDLGMVFFGITLTSLVSFWLPGYTNEHHHTIAIIIVIVSFIFGACFIFFQYQLANKDEENTNTAVAHIIELMDLIEGDYANQLKKSQNS